MGSHLMRKLFKMMDLLYKIKSKMTQVCTDCDFSANPSESETWGVDGL